MIPQKSNISIETSEQFKQKTCGIGDVSIIFDILRNKLYSDPIGSIIREISCNARDANRESNNKNTPIEIKFPNTFDSNYIIKDSGIGISPQRMNEIYCNYGSSTKRKSNEYIGSFGIGSKSILSYTEQFSIKTTTKENNENITRTYIFYIDETQIGTISLINENKLNLPTGTEIIIPVETKDFQEFIDKTLFWTKYWNIRPILSGISPLPIWKEDIGNLLCEGNNWKIYGKKSDNYYENQKSKILVIIDGIQYSLDQNFINNDNIWLINENLHIYFNIGELSLSASRETLHYNENTIKLINDKISDIQKEISLNVKNIIESKKSYLEAIEIYSYFNKYFRKLLKNNKYYWQNHEVFGSEIFLPKELFLNKDKYYKFLLYAKEKKSIRSKEYTRIILDNKIKYYYNDLNPNHFYRNKIEKLLQTNNAIVIINFEKNKTYKDFVDFIKNKHKEISNNLINYYNKSSFIPEDHLFIFDLLIQPELLSSVIEDKKQKNLPKPKLIKSEKIKAYSYIETNNYNFKYNYKNTEIEKNQDNYFFEINFSKKSRKINYNGNIWNLSNFDLKFIYDFVKNQNEIIYAIKEKDIPKLGNKWKNLSQLIEKTYNSLFNDKYLKSLAISHIMYDYNNELYNPNHLLINETGFKNILNLENKIINNGSIKKYLNYAKILNKNEYYNSECIKRISEILNKKNNYEKYNHELKILIDEIKVRYPLLENINQYDQNYEKIIDYINMCDKFEELNNRSIKNGK